MTFKNDLILGIEGEVRFDEASRHIYSVDASIYEVMPVGVVIPKTKEDVRKAVKTAAHYRVPIIARGAATGTSGGCLGRGLIIDTTKYLNKILEINCDKGYAICHPGVIQDDLNAALEPLGYQLGPNTSTGNRATIGGMLANNAAGSHSLVYGQMEDHILEVEVALSSGEVVIFREISLDKWKENRQNQNSKGKIYKQLWDIREEYNEAIIKEFPKISRRSSGYNLEALIKEDRINVCRLLAGSEGSLGIATKIKLKIVPKQKTKTLAVLHFSSLLDSIRAVGPLLGLKPSAIELIDKDIIERGKVSWAMKGRLSWLKDDPAAVIVVEFLGESEDKIKILKQNFPATVLDEKLASDIWAVRKAGLELLLSKRSYQRAIAFIEDLAVPSDRVLPFMEEFLKILEKTGRTAGIYGHIGESCLHIRPYINLMKEDDLMLMKEMMAEVSSLILKYGGVMSGEHGDGYIRSWLNKKMFTPSIYDAFCRVKSAFDPHNLMNPGKVVHGDDPIHDLRSNPQTELSHFKTALDFSPEGGFELAVDMCNGNGLCRKKEGLMCPSFQATLDEYDSTRARAQVLRSIIHGRLKPKSLAHKDVHKVLDLCLECKGCKRECPSGVDMAKMKSEALYHHHKRKGFRLRSTLFAHIGEMSRFASKIPRLINFLSKFKLIKRLGGIADERTLPKIAAQTFSDWFASFNQPENCKRKVVLFNDTFTEFNHPEVGIAATAVLNAMGYRVELPNWSCCGRPLISKGMLHKAKKKAEKLIQTFLPFADRDIPIIILEPSCHSVFLDELMSLVPSDKAKKLSESCMSFDRFLEERIAEIPFKKMPCTIKLHGHCHQKAMEGTHSAINVLSAIPGADAVEIPSGCCGMAGSFGYEKEHYELSMKIGRLKLFQAVKESKKNTFVVASGTSCRAQILHGTGIYARHLAEMIALSIKKD